MRKWVEVLNFDPLQANLQRDCFELNVDPQEQTDDSIRGYTKVEVLIELELTDPIGLSLSEDRKSILVHMSDGNGAYAVAVDNWRAGFTSYRKAVRLRRAGGNPRLALRHAIEDGEYIDVLASGWETVEYDTSINWERFERAAVEVFGIKDTAALASFMDTANDLLVADDTRTDEEVLLDIFDLLSAAATAFGV
jgi:hypothetical protein